jgi:hypothetical protein
MTVSETLGPFVQLDDEKAFCCESNGPFILVTVALDDFAIAFWNV